MINRLLDDLHQVFVGLIVPEGKGRKAKMEAVMEDEVERHAGAEADHSAGRWSSVASLVSSTRNAVSPTSALEA